MQRTIMLAVAAAAIAASAAAGAEYELTLQLRGPTQAQSAGYHVALAKGYYAAEDLDIDILPGDPSVPPAQVLASGRADVIVEWMPAALVARDKGLPLVNIAQPFASSGLTIVCHPDAGIADPLTDLAGKIIGTRFRGDEYPLLAWANGLNLPADGTPGGVALINQGAGIDALLDKQAACISAMSYDGYPRILETGLNEEDLLTLHPGEWDAATLEDGLYTLESTLADDAMVEALARFVRASMKGWEDATANPAEAAEIVLAQSNAGATTLAEQTRMITGVSELIAGSDGRLALTDYERTVETLMRAGPNTVLSSRPQGAHTSVVTDRARD